MDWRQENQKADNQLGLITRRLKRIAVALAGITLTACATYYTKNIQFQEYVRQGRFEKAEETLERNKKAKSGRNELLYYMEQGYVDWMLGNYKESNQHFSKADNIIEDQINNYGREALALITNPSVKPYEPEDFEIVLVNYFKALNYLALNDYDAALVECRKINIKLNSLNDKYKDHKNRYQRDAFAHTLMGLIYEANLDYNNAFIAYRNALEVYEEDYLPEFGIDAPEQLKHDLLRSAYLTGFYDEVRYYEKRFSIIYRHKTGPKNEMVFFWLNGFGPVKSEWSINLTNVKGEGGWITFTNEEYGISAPIYIGDKKDEEKSAFENLRFLRIAFPKYEERLPVFTSASITVNGQQTELELLQDINEIAFKTLRDRMIREVSNSVLRLATKKALESMASKQDEGLGTIVSIANALTEKADTRNWQTLPYSISYARIPYPEGGKVDLKTTNNRGTSKTHSIDAGEPKRIISFYTFHTIDTHPPGFVLP